MPNDVPALNDLPVRRTARLLVFDPAGRLLMIRYRVARILPPLSKADPTILYTPGGGLEPGETSAAAAARELDEECGIRGAAISPVVARREARNLFFIRPSFSIEAYHVVRAPDARLDTSRLAETDIDPVVEVRWWPLDELAATAIHVIPAGLAGLAARCLSGDIPAQPVMLQG